MEEIKVELMKDDVGNITKDYGNMKLLYRCGNSMYFPFVCLIGPHWNYFLGGIAFLGAISALFLYFS